MPYPHNYDDYDGPSERSDRHERAGDPSPADEDRPGALKKFFESIKTAFVSRKRDVHRYTHRREDSQAAQEWRREATILQAALADYGAGRPQSLPPVGDEYAPRLKRRSTLGSFRKSRQDSGVVVVRSSEAYNRLEYTPTVSEEEYYRPRPRTTYEPSSPATQSAMF